MLIIDSTYFKGNLSLPNIPVLENTADSGVALAIQTVGEKNINVFVDKYVVGYLIQLFGRELTLSFIAGLEEDPIPGIWENLREQLLIKTHSHKASPLANYVYYWLMRDAITKTTQSGELRPKPDDAQIAEIKLKLVTAWSEMVDMTVQILDWFFANKNDYEDYVGRASGADVNNLITPINTMNI
jgi:hypothetical protein